MIEDDLLEQIRARAYEIWLGEGCPGGRDRIHWLKAEAEFREKFAAAHPKAECKEGLHGSHTDTRGQEGQKAPRNETQSRKRTKR